MTLIKCPSCNHTILSLASRCPNCGFHLTQPRFQQGLSGSLAECRECGRKVLSKTRQCPYCGAQHPVRTGRTGLVLGAAGVVAAFVVLTIAAQQLEPRPPERSGEVAKTPGAVGDLPLEHPVEVTPRGSVTDAAPVGAEPPGVEPGASRQGAAFAPARPEPSTALEEGVRRWVSNWANVREGRSLQSPVLRVLPPGREVVVANRVNGWWEVYLGGSFVGYIAGSLLLSELPDTLIPRR